MDDGHGLRGAELARALRGKVFELGDARFELLYKACMLHTDGYRSGDVNLAACWDADRLDLGRAGITPLPEKLCTDKASVLIEWANPRAVEGAKPSRLLEEWGVLS